MAGVPFIGIVDVALFDSNADMSFLATHELSPVFRDASDWALIKTGVQSVIPYASIDSLTSYVFGINVETASSLPSLFTIGVGVTTEPANAASFIDGYCVYAENAWLNHGAIDIRIAQQPIAPGDYTSPFGKYEFEPVVNTPTGIVVGGELINDYQLTKGNFNFEPCIMGFENPGVTIFIAPFYLNIGGPVEGSVPQQPLSGINNESDLPGSCCTCRLVKDPALPPYIPQFDNSFITNNDGMFYCEWFSVTGSANYYGLEIDDTGLSGGLAALFQTATPQSWANGYLFVVETMGAGPTGQLFEVIVMDGKASQWWLLRFNPMDATSGDALDPIDSTGWSVKIDPLGILWFNPQKSSTATKMFFSYSPLEFWFPWLNPQVLNPITLPCYSTCNPVNFAD